MTKTDKKTILAQASKIKLTVFDVDGVLTDGRLILGENGNEYKCFHVRDGQGILMLLGSGCRIAIITARTSNIVSERMAALGITHVYQNERNKGKRLLSLMQDLKLEQEQIAYVGDDVIDLSAMVKVGLSIAVGDAHPSVKSHADWVTTQYGGRGAVREVCELIMQAQGTLEKKIAAYLL